MSQRVIPSTIANRHPTYRTYKGGLRQILWWILGTGSTLLLPAAIAIANSPPAGTVIQNQATGSFTDPGSGSTENIESNIVLVTVAEVAGITAIATGPTEAPSGVANAGPNQGDGTLNPEDVVYFTFQMTNVGNDPTQFFIPGNATITNGSLSGQIQIVAYNTNGSSGTTLTTPVNIASSGVTTGSALGLPNGSIAPSGTVTVRVPVKVSAGLANNTQVSVVLGDTAANNRGNQPYNNGGNSLDLYTQDNQDGDGVDVLATTGVETEAPGMPVNGDSTFHRQEASASQFATIALYSPPPPAICISPSSATFNTANYSLNTPLQNSLPLTFLSGSMSFNASLSGTATWTGGVQVQNDLTVGDYLFLQPSNTANYLSSNNKVTYIFSFPQQLTSFAMVGSGLNNDDGTTITASYQGIPIRITAANFSNLSPGMILKDADGDGQSDTVVSSNTTGGVSVNTNTYNLNITGPIDTITVVSGKDSTSTGTVTIGLRTFEYCTQGATRNVVDYGDAPDSYGTTNANNGARHTIVSGLYLGTAPDSESDAVLPLNGSGDGADEDGITLPMLTAGDTSYTIPASNIAATGSGTLHGWVDFDENGVFSASEYASVAVTNGIASGNLVWNSITAGAAGNTYARFRFTTDASINASKPSGLAGNGEVEDYSVTVTAAVASSPEVLLAKRITAINRGLVNEQIFNALANPSYVNVGNNADADNAPNWPGPSVTANAGSSAGTPVESYLMGITGISDITAVENTTIQPGDELEYTIPFLSNGNTAARDLLICDRIPLNTAFLPTAFNSSTSAAAGPDDRGIFISFNGLNVALTNVNDGDEIANTGGNDNGIGGYYFAPGVDPSSAFPGKTVGCGGSNTNGAIVVDLSDVPNATGDGIPTDSYGFIRFRAVVN